MEIDVDRIMELCEGIYNGEYIGVCVSCGHEQDGVEPDARRYTCEECGEEKVFGAEELLLRIA